MVSRRSRRVVIRKFENLELRRVLTLAFVDSGQSLGSASSSSVALGDLDGDGDLDAWVTNFLEPNTVWLNDGGGTFTDSGQELGSSLSYRVALGDVDSDGDLDAMVANAARSVEFDPSDPRSSERGPDRLWLNDGLGNFVDSGQEIGNLSSRDVALRDLDGDGDLDAFIGISGFSFPGSYPDQVWVNDGQGGFSNTGQALGRSATEHIALSDLDGDGDVDAWTSGDRGRVWLNDGTASFSEAGNTFGAGTINDAVALGDLNGDGFPDIWFANGDFLDSESHRIWLNDGSGGLEDSGQALPNPGPSPSVALGDLDGDNDLDAWVASAPGFSCCSSPDRIWLNDGAGSFSRAELEIGNTSSRGVAIGDLDGDDDLDAFVISGGLFSLEFGAGPNKVWFNQSSQLVPGDVNGDGLVGFSDFLVLANSFGRENANRADGDLDGNGTVNFADFLILAENYDEPT